MTKGSFTRLFSGAFLNGFKLNLASKNSPESNVCLKVM
jgi:hypothetical protein